MAVRRPSKRSELRSTSIASRARRARPGLNHLERERLHAESINETILQYQHPGTDLSARVVAKLLARFVCVLEQKYSLFAERDKLTQLQWQEQIEN